MYTEFQHSYVGIVTSNEIIWFKFTAHLIPLILIRCKTCSNSSITDGQVKWILNAVPSTSLNFSVSRVET